MKLKQMWPEQADGIELKQALLTTYELVPARSFLRIAQYDLTL